MSRIDELATEARRRAQELTNGAKRQETERLAERENQRHADAAKTARLKELRLAKEAADAAVAKSADDARKGAKKPAELKRSRQKSGAAG